jgi:hypothetical protein
MKRLWFVLAACGGTPAAKPAPVVQPAPVVAQAQTPAADPAPAPPPAKKENIHRCSRKLVGVKDVDAVRALIAAEKCNGNANDAFGKTALMSAAEAGRLDVVNVLVELGADVNEGQSSGNGMGETGKTALWFAVEADHPDVVAALLRAGADPNQSPNQGVPLLILAAMHETPACAKLLVEAGVAKDQTTASGKTAMEYYGGPSAQVFVYLESVGVKADGLPAAAQESLRWEATTSPTPAEVALKTKSTTARKFAIKHLADEPPDVAVPALIAVATGPSIDNMDWGAHDAILTLTKFDWGPAQDKAQPKLL